MRCNPVRVAGSITDPEDLEDLGGLASYGWMGTYGKRHGHGVVFLLREVADVPGTVCLETSDPAQLRRLACALEEAAAWLQEQS